MDSNNYQSKEGQKGLERLGEILGTTRSETTLEKFESIAPDFARYTAQFAWGELYARPTLSDKLKEFAAVTSLLTQGKQDLLAVHINGMLNVGWTQQEIVELITFLIVYVGFPSTSQAILTAIDVFSIREKIK